jgi:hypothetical protein
MGLTATYITFSPSLPLGPVSPSRKPLAERLLLHSEITISLGFAAIVLIITICAFGVIAIPLSLTWKKREK